MAKQLQFAVSFLPVQDRLRIAGLFPDGNEVRLLLTRRLVRGLLGSVGEVAKKMVPEEVPGPQAKKEVAKFKREAAVQQANFTTKFSGGQPHPDLGEEAQLVREIQISPEEDGKVRIRINLVKKKYIETALPADTFWGLIHLIETQAKKAEWNLGPRTLAPRQTAKQKPEEKPVRPRLN
ncbi:MAG: hypothetical protein HOI34_15040 [Rhodospirillaceae bacterium]|nr:hypothetical protein [Rhodospirillaceae bacterium]MBT7613722.1 hypothetical protein [Rhodospirillaceae bacterium]